MKNDFKFRNFGNGNYKRSGGQHCHSKCTSTGSSEFAMPMLTFCHNFPRGKGGGEGWRAQGLVVEVGMVVRGVVVAAGGSDGW